MTFIHFLTGFYPTMGTCFTGWWLTSSLGGMSSSVGMMKFPIYGKTKFMFQTTKQFKVVNGFEVPSGNLLQFAKFAIKHGHRNS